MNRKRTMIFVLTACFLAAAAFPASAQEYEIIELGTLGGTSTRARVITEDGVVYGWSTLASGEKHAVRWDASGIVDLGAPPGFLSASPAAANDAGQVAINGEGDPQSFRGYLWDAGSWTPMGVLPGTSESTAADIDSGGRMVGTSFVLGGEYRAVIWDAGVLTDLGTLGSDSSARSINETGQIVGYSDIDLPDGGQSQRGFLWENGAMTVLDPPPDYRTSYAVDINELGQIVGSGTLFVPPYFTTHHALLWDNGTVIRLDSVPGYGRTSAADINNLGQVVGNAAGSISGGPYTAYLWQDGVAQRLNDLVSPDSVWDLTTAAAINDAGQILAHGRRYPDDPYVTAFLLQPPTACTHDSECIDGVFCDGVEVCVGGWCQNGADPCPGQGCNEGIGACVPLTCNGDGVCGTFEDCNSCPSDCISSQPPGCGDGICQPSSGEDCLSCEADCRGKLKGKASARYCCGGDVDCTDARCNREGWVCDDAPQAPFCCGDGSCDAGEDRCSCAIDCGDPPPTETDCGDGFDNDCDGATDGLDSECLCRSKGAPCTWDNHCCSGICKRNGMCR